MAFALGAMMAFSTTLVIVLVFAWVKYNSLNGKLADIQKTIASLPLTAQSVVQNIIHLGMKDGRVNTDLTPVTLSIRPEDFLIRADKLCEKLLHGLATESHPNTSTLAYCVLKHAGLDNMLDGQSWGEAQKALTRLLTNGDDEATQRFLSTLASSIAHATVPVESAPTK